MNASVSSSVSTINSNQFTITASDASAIGAYAIAGSLSASASALGSAFSGAFVGAGTGNTINRPVQAVIGNPNATTIGNGSISAANLTITAQRTDTSRIISDAAGAAIAFAKTSGSGSGAYAASFAGGFAFNTIEGGITSGVYNITGLSVSGSTTILSQALTAGKQGTSSGNIYSFAGGFAVSASIGSESTSIAAGALGLAITRNTINDSLKAQISNIQGRVVSGLAGGATRQIQLGALSVSAKNLRLINAEATGDALTLSTGGSTASAFAVAIGAAHSTNTINSDVLATVDLGNSVELLLGGALDQLIDPVVAYYQAEALRGETTIQ